MNTPSATFNSTTSPTTDIDTAPTVPALQTSGRTQSTPVPAAANPLAGWIADALQAETQRQDIERREQERLEIARARFAAD